MKNLTLNIISMISGGYSFKCRCEKIIVNQHVAFNGGSVVYGSTDWHEYLIMAPANDPQTVQEVKIYCNDKCQSIGMQMTSCTQQ